ncbi:MAG: PHP domain-containing protein [Clostridia bacterium]|nr:PHP domain-containing protein [Clostridia bacterium]
MRFPIDMHCHSVRSDGGDTYEELCEVAVRNGVRMFAVADHDIVPDLNPDGTDLLSFGKRFGVRILPAIELSCDTLVPDVHIVGIGCDFEDSAFHSFEEDMIRSKVDSYKKIVSLLIEDGLHISWEDVLHQNGGTIEEEHVQGKHLFNAIAACGGAEDWSEAKKMIQTTPRYAAVKREKIKPVDAVDMIRRTGGFSILAHPHLIMRYPRDIKRSAYIENLVEAGLQGIEAAYPYDKTSYRGSHTPQEVEEMIRGRFEGRIFISGGSDYHDDAKFGSKNPRIMGEKGIMPETVRACPELYRIVKEWVPDFDSIFE